MSRFVKLRYKSMCNHKAGYQYVVCSGSLTGIVLTSFNWAQTVPIFPQNMMRVSVSYRRERARRHGSISVVGDPFGKLLLYLKNGRIPLS